MADRPSYDSSNVKQSSQCNYYKPVLHSSSLSSFQNNIRESIFKSKSCTTTGKTESSASNKPENEEDNFAYWLKKDNQNRLLQKTSQSSLEIKDLEVYEEEAEMIISSTSPSDYDIPYVNNMKLGLSPHEEEVLRWKSALACHCCLCFNKLMEHLPKPPQGSIEVNKSHSLNNIYSMCKQTELQNESQKVMQTNIQPLFLIRTREQDSGQIVTFRSDILNFQGKKYSHEDIAPTWKKDCRMWLWKSVCASRKRKLLQNNQQ